MDVFILNRNLQNTDDELVAISVRGSRGDVYFQEFVICPRVQVKEQCNLIFTKAIKYIKETLVDEKGYSIKRLNVTGDIFSLPYNEYAWKRSNGNFNKLSKYLKKGTPLHEACKELYEYIKKMKGINIDFDNWEYSNGYMRSSHKEIRKELGKLAGNYYYDEDKMFNKLLEWL